MIDRARYQAAQRLLMDDAAAIFYADILSRVAYQANIEGLVVNPAYNAVFFYNLSRGGSGG